MKLKLAILILLGLTLILFLSRKFTLGTPPENILRTTSGRTNFLILGMGGAGHEAADLTDTIIFISLNPLTKDTVLLSVPRDLWVPSLRAKINTAYHYGGLPSAKTAVAEILGQPVDYAVALDFAGFTQAIDLVGGINIDVPQTFDDFQYPIPGQEDAPLTQRYEQLHFDAGLQHMTGDRALKYVRSRNAASEAGTDFARSHRQQQVLSALKDKIFSSQTLFNPARLIELKRTLATSLIHDLSDAEIIALAKLAVGFSTQNLRSGTLDTGDATRSGLLVHPPVSARYDSQWVLIPKDSLDSIHQYINQLLFK
jgi:polyisoprenyl-teichoic acid--peptidoglycan teichoic acid transferase